MNQGKQSQTDYDKSPQLAFGYSATATFDSPKVSLPSTSQQQQQQSVQQNRSSPFGRNPVHKQHNSHTLSTVNSNLNRNNLKVAHRQVKSDADQDKILRARSPPPLEKELPPNHKHSNDSKQSNKMALAAAQPLSGHRPLNYKKKRGVARNANANTRTSGTFNVHR